MWHLLDLDRRAIFNLAPLEVRNLIASVSIPGSWLPQKHMNHGCEYGGFALGCSTSLTESMELSPLGPRSQKERRRLGYLRRKGGTAAYPTRHLPCHLKQEPSVSWGKSALGRGAPVNHRGASSDWQGPHRREVSGRRRRGAERGAEGC